MTDWIVGVMTNDRKNIHPAVQPGQIAAAGGDLVMPGCAGDRRSILKALKTGSLTREQLLINASRVYRMAKKLTPRK